MNRHAWVLLSVLLLGGCVTTASNYYSYEGAGDYYYGEGAADVLIDNSGYYYGFAGYGYGYGYGNLYPWWGYAYPPIGWAPSYPHDDSGMLRDARVQYSRATRSALLNRDTVHAPDTKKWMGSPFEYLRPQPGSRESANVRAERSSLASRAGSPPSRAPVRQAPMTQSRPIPSRPMSMPSPGRSAPISHKQ